MNKKIMFITSILVVILFLLQPVATISVGHDKNTIVDQQDFNSSEIESVSDSTTRTTSGSFPTGETSSVQPKGFREKMKENRERMMAADPNVPVPEYDFDEIILREEDLVAMDRMEFLERSKPEEIRFGLPGSQSGTRGREHLPPTSN